MVHSLIDIVFTLKAQQNDMSYNSAMDWYNENENPKEGYVTLTFHVEGHLVVKERYGRRDFERYIIVWLERYAKSKNETTKMRLW